MDGYYGWVMSDALSHTIRLRIYIQPPYLAIRYRISNMRLYIKH